MDQIIPGLWIGDLACALATDYLATAGITHIVTAMKQALPVPIKLPDGRIIEESHVFNVHLDDVENAPILVHFPGAVDFIDEVLQQSWLEDDDNEVAHANSGEQVDGQEPNNSQGDGGCDISGRAYRPPGRKPGQWATMGEGSVLVHCHAGISRSVAITCAYLMHTRHMPANEALKLIQSRRAIASPNSGFMHQLELYESGGYEVDVRNQRTRRFLMSQASILKGNPIDDVMLSYYPSPLHSPAASLSGSSSHGGLGESLQISSIDRDAGKDNSARLSPSQHSRKDAGAATSSASEGSASSSRVISRRNSRAAASSAAAQLSLERVRANGCDPVVDNDAIQSRISIEGSDASSSSRPRTRARSNTALSISPPIASQAGELFDKSDEPGERDVLTEELIKETFTSIYDPHEVKVTVSNGILPGGVARVRGNEGHAHSRAWQYKSNSQQANSERLPKPHFGAQKLRCKKCRRELAARDHVIEHEAGRGKDAFDVRKREKDVSQKSRDGRAAVDANASTDGHQDIQQDGALEQTGSSRSPSDDRSSSADEVDAGPKALSRPSLQSADALSASLPPHLAALRLGRAQAAPNGSAAPVIGPNSANGSTIMSASTTPTQPSRKMLHSPLCTSYFVEPLAWMSALQAGEVAGRLDCPSTRCGAKLGSWDWAGMQCACGAWVTPAFALHKSKVDEV